MRSRPRLKWWLLLLIGCAACSSGAVPQASAPPDESPTPSPTSRPSRLPLTPQDGDSIVPRMTLGGNGSHYTLAWSPDGQRIAAGGSAGELHIYDMRQKALAVVVPGHADAIADVGTDGGRWLTASWDGSLRGWGLTRGETHSALDGVILDKFWASDFSSDGLFAVSDAEESIRVLRLETGEEVTRLRCDSGEVRTIRFSPQGDMIAAATTLEAVCVWRLAEGQALATFETGLTGGNAHALAWSPDGARLATGGAQGRVLVWDVDRGELLTTLQGHWDDVSAMAWSPNGALLATGGSFEYHQLILWDTHTWGQVSSFGRHENRIYDIAWSADGTRFASVDSATKLIVWGLADSMGVTPQESPRLGTQAETFEAYEDFIIDIRALALESYDFNATLREKGTYTMTIPPADLGAVLWQMGWCAATADILDDSWSKMDLRFVINGEPLSEGDLLTQILRRSEDEICQWTGVMLSDWPFGEHVLRLEIVFNELIDDGIASDPYPAGETVWEFHVFSDRNNTTPHTQATDQASELGSEAGRPPSFSLAKTLQADGKVWSLSWSPDGRSVAGSLYAGGMIVWDVDSGNRWPPIAGDEAAWSDDGELLAIDARFEVDIMDGSGGETLRKFDPGELLLDLQWSPVERVLGLALLNDVVSLWDADGGNRIAEFANEAWGDVSDLAWSPDGTTIALTGRGVFLIDQQDGSLSKTFPDCRYPAWSPDGKRIAAESSAGLVVMDVDTAAKIFEIPMAFSAVSGPPLVAWSPNGLWIATANDLQIGIWEAQSGEPLAILGGHEDRVNAVQFSPDGVYLASASEDSTVILWEIEW